MTDSEQISVYCQCVFDETDIVEVRAIHREEGKPLCTWHTVTEIPEQIARLRGLNITGYNIYIGANPRPAVGINKDEAITTCRCLFADFDHLDVPESTKAEDVVVERLLDNELPLPTMLMNSGHGIHAYWRLCEPISPQVFHELQERLAFTLDSDPKIKNPERIMRLPGFENVKEEPFVPCFIIASDPARRVALAEIEYNLTAIPTLDAMPPAVPRNTNYLEARGRAALYAAKWASVGQGERNQTAFVHAKQLVNDFDISEGEAFEIVADWNQSNSPPLPEPELRQAFNSAVKTKSAKPRGCKLSEPTRREARTANQPIDPKQSDPMGAFRQHQADIASGHIRCVPLPWPRLSELTRALFTGYVTILAGTKGSAKTFMAQQMVASLLGAGERVAVCILEGSVTEYLGRALAQLADNAELTNPDWVKDHYEETQAIEAEHRGTLTRLAQCVTRAPLGATLEQVAAWVYQQTKAGVRVIVVDPVTMAMRTSQPWIADKAFVDSVKHSAEEFGASVMLVSHLQKGAVEGATDVLAGSAAYERFSDCIIQLRRHDAKASAVKTACGTTEIEHNQSIFIEKARAPGSGCRLAFAFHSSNLTLEEIGVIVKKKKDRNE